MDAENLNRSLDTEIGNQINELIRQLDYKQLERFKSEFKLLANLFIWFKTINRNQTTIGHKIFDLKFSSDLPKHKFYVQLFCSVIYPFLETKFEQYNSSHPLSIYFNQLQKTFKFFNFINFLIFLRTGSYTNFWYRFFKIDPHFINQQPNLNQATYEFMNRELVWSTAIDFLTFIIPIIDLNKSWMKLKSIFIDEQSFRLNQLDRPIKRTDQDYEKCNHCSDYPFDPHEFGCRHVYCFYCVISQFELTNQMICYKCKLRINNRDLIKRINLRS